MTALLLLILCSAAQAAPRRAVMESLATTGNALFVSTNAVRVGVGTATPATTLDVTGTAQFGSTAKSTFSAAGDLAFAANADITLSGSTGYFSGQSSVTASAFFGDGSHLTGISTGSVAQSTRTYNLTGSTTETTNFRTCYATGTITTGGTRPVMVYYSGSLTASGASGHYCVINFLQDGTWISPYSITVGMGAGATSSAGGFGTATTTRVLPAPSAGGHSWCVSLIAPFGDTCSFTFSSAHGNEFGVTEL